MAWMHTSFATRRVSTTVHSGKDRPVDCQSPPGPGATRIYREESLLLIALLRTLWRLSYQDMHDWLVAWPALALACGLPVGRDGRPRIPSASQQWKRACLAGAPMSEALFVLSVLTAIRRRLIGARDLIIDSAPILAWRCADPDAALGHAPAQHPRALLRGYRVHTLLCRGSGLPIFFLLSPANVHDAPFARPLLEWAVRLYAIRPRIVRLDAAYWGVCLIAWIHATLHAVAVVPWTPNGRRTVRACLPLGPKTNSASAVPSNASLAASFSSFTYNAPLYVAGRPSSGRSP
jgi:Transposase DDE domain